MKLYEAQQKSVARQVGFILPILIGVPVVTGILLWKSGHSWLSIGVYSFLTIIVVAICVELLVEFSPIGAWIDAPFSQVTEDE